MPSLLHWKLPKSRSGRRSLKVSTLLAKDKAGTLFHKHGEHDEGGKLEDLETQARKAKSMERRYARMLERRGENPNGSLKHAVAGGYDQTYIDGDDPGVTGSPAPLRRKRLEIAARDEVDPNPYPKTEDRNNTAGTTLIGDIAPLSGFSDTGKFSAALQTLGQLSRSWEGPSDDRPSRVRSDQEEDERGPFHLSLGEISSQAGQDEMDTKGASAQFPKVSGLVDNTMMDEGTVKMAQAFHRGFVEELARLGYIPENELLKEAISLAGIGTGLRSMASRVMPMAAAGAGPEVAAMRKGTNFFSTGIGSGLHQGGKMLAHNAPAAGQAAGLAAKDVGALGAMRPTSAGRRIAGETAIGAGHHMQHAGPGLMAMNPVGVPMGGAIEGFTRGVGKELQGSGSQALQSAGHSLVRHAPKVGFGGEFVAGGLLGTPGLGAMAGHQLAGMAGEHVMHAAHGLIPHTLGAGVQEASMAAPRLLPRMGQAAGNMAMGLKARAGNWGGKLVGA